MKINLLKVATFAVLCAGLVFTSCKKDEPEPEPEPEFSKIDVLHFVPGAPQVALFDGDTRLLGNNTVSYQNNTGYQQIPSGNKIFNIKPGPAYDAVVASRTINLVKDKSYSLMAVPSDAGNNSIILHAIEDDLSAPLAGKAKVRFFHFAKSAPNVDLAFNNVVQFSNRANQANATNLNGEYIQIDPSVGYNIVVRAAGTGTNRTAARSLTIEAGKSYTIVYRGVSGSGGAEAEGFDFIENK